MVSQYLGDGIMPDIERLTRQCHIDLADLLGGEHEKREVEAFYRGVDAARKEVVWIVLIVAGVTVFIQWFAG
jgi:hypothetical protein